jgi:hypothetical protein
VLFWRPQAALFVNELTLLQIMMPLPPSTSTLERFPLAAAEVLHAHGVHSSFVEREVAEMIDCCLTKIRNRSVLGVMNEFAYLAGAYRDRAPELDVDLVQLSLRLATTPCSPLYGSHTSPDRALAAIA